ncbi:uncharacterized protein LOC114533802 [Dendronephthya gigantea]|uniref:uncharacterized protein LOC114533802 n=1 Tax=Dendronephthya gigantea TaxID=151771 RepID=UPI00106AABD3|nr:uncharacterized protein LOC114533802 [Dendronephthya gigantea]
MEIIEKFPIDPALQDSTFSHIGQDKKRKKSTCQNIYESTIKKDYPPLGFVSKQDRLPSPKPAKIFSVDSQINEQRSLTATHFVKQSTTERTKLSEVAKLVLGTKNLTKMDVDNNSTMAFDTTHKVYFPVRISEKVKRKEDMMKSSIPQGDKEKVNIPFSNYRQSFLEDKLSQLDVASPAKFEATSMLHGDAKFYEDQFETTNKKTFRGQYTLPQRMKAVKNNVCSIRHGDPKKVLYAVTTNQKFFKEKPLKRVDPCGPNYIASIILGDSKEKWSLVDHKTKRELFPCVETQHLVSRQAKLNMAKSNIPFGDSEKSQGRFTQTTHDSFFKRPVISSPYKKVDGAYLLTKSKVKFGAESAVGQQHYNTTMSSNFSAKSEPVIRSDWQTTNSNVCLNYYGNEMNQSTTVSDFPSYSEAKRLVPDTKYLSKITASHIQMPRALISEFRTSHNISYPIKQSKRETYEAGKLHKSSIKLGNISVR